MKCENESGRGVRRYKERDLKETDEYNVIKYYLTNVSVWLYGDEIYLRPARERERKWERHFEFYEKEKTKKVKWSEVKSSSATVAISEVKDEGED